MKYNKILLALACLSSPIWAQSNPNVQREIDKLQAQTEQLQAQLTRLKQQMAKQKTTPAKQASSTRKKLVDRKPSQYHTSEISIHASEKHPESLSFYPIGLIADEKVVTYIAGTPVVTSPYLGDRPAFDGSDYIVNISSINRDIRLMQQRRRLYRAFHEMGYPVPPTPIIAISGKVEPIGTLSNPFRSTSNGDITLGSSELDIAANLNPNVEAFMSIAYDESPPDIGPRTDNSAFSLNMGFVNVGNLDKTPFYFTAGQLYVPFGRYSSSMISAPITLNLARTKARPFIVGYKSQEDTGPFASAYVYRSDTTLGKSGVGGGNFGYIFHVGEMIGEVDAGYISNIDDAGGMQYNGAVPNTTFGGFGSFTNGSEAVRKTQAVNINGHVGIDRFNFAAEWVGTTQPFRAQDLSFNNHGARPSAGQLEIDMTFRAFNRPASVGATYQWSREALALNLPEQRISGVFNISIWKDTVESLEYRHDIDYGATQFANGAAPQGVVNAPIIGTGHSSDTVSAQIGVFF